MTGADEFTPRLGRIRDRGAASGKRYSARVRKAAAKLGPGGRSKFTGARSGRGSGTARAAQFRKHPFAKFRMRRVVVKVHIARAGKGIGKAAFKAHLKYIQRDGVDRLGEDGKSLGGDLYNEAGDKLGDTDFVSRSEDDRHQFRVILSPEDGDRLGDLKENTRSFMARMEKDLCTKLDWVAVDHYNTGHPHTHIVIRGRDDRGKDLVIAKEYLTKGMRRAASDLVTERLGPRRDLEIARTQASEVKIDRFTGIDRRIELDLDGGARVLGSEKTPYDRFERSLRLQRLSHLQGLGLAQKREGGDWALEPGWQDTLKTMGKRGDVIRTLSAMKGVSRDVALFDARRPDQSAVVGRVLTTQAEDELRDTRALIVEAVDGKTWHVPIGPHEPGALPPTGVVIEAKRAEARPRPADRTIANVARVNGGLYSEGYHREDDPSASKDFVQAHIRRLEALRRAGLVQRFANGDWAIPDDYPQKAAGYEADRSKGAAITIKSWVSLEDQVTSLGPAWIDEVKSDGLSKTGFGKDVAAARQNRMAHLKALGKVPDASAALETAAAALSGKTHGAYRAVVSGQRFEGVYQRPINLSHGRFALVTRSKDFTLVPWRPELEKARGITLNIKRTGKGIQWTLGKARGIGR